ncbi:MAG TPA: c-type cytochrome, methanol metabolism-related [Rhodopila sp.]|nr:c-type cytochrome, methanol metabolism-related [Rhodopila sp.]
MNRHAGIFVTAGMALCLTASLVRADPPGDPAAVSSEDGKYADKDGNPTYKVDKDGKVDFYSYIGFVRYSANCLQCHGPDGLGSTYAPSLVNSLKNLNYGDFMATVAGGKKDVSEAQQLVMPALGENKNVMCYIDAIYVYLRGRSTGAIGRGRPAAHEPKPDAFSKAEDACMG